MSDRLSPEVRPQSYTLHYSIDFNNFSFDGSVETQIAVSASCSLLRLHCEKLVISSLTLLHGEREVPVSFSLVGDGLHITADQPFPTGTYMLRISFSGQLADDLSGLYRSRYTDKTGTDAFLATTQFEAPYARRAFPCFDEPQFKA
ncbi:MAG: hypothetical protein GF350_04530, partial [Chitinivibrionales bacterium]|nr:hypothetical protein [Chitinivibrionales bacterium]